MNPLKNFRLNTLSALSLLILSCFLIYGCAKDPALALTEKQSFLFKLPCQLISKQNTRSDANSTRTTLCTYEYDSYGNIQSADVPGPRTYSFVTNSNGLITKISADKNNWLKIKYIESQMVSLDYQLVSKEQDTTTRLYTITYANGFIRHIIDSVSGDTSFSLAWKNKNITAVKFRDTNERWVKLDAGPYRQRPNMGWTEIYRLFEGGLDQFDMFLFSENDWNHLDYYRNNPYFYSHEELNKYGLPTTNYHGMSWLEVYKNTNVYLWDCH